MQIYLPIAEVSVNAFLLLGLGGLVGVLSGMFGVGGGFLMTPLLFFIGIPPAVAVALASSNPEPRLAPVMATRLPFRKEPSYTESMSRYRLLFSSLALANRAG